MQALIDPAVNGISYVSGWEPNVDPIYPQYRTNRPIYSNLPSSERVCEVVPDDQTFGVADPLFWTSCSSDCVADLWYYDTSDNTCKIIPVVLPPA